MSRNFRTSPRRARTERGNVSNPLGYLDLTLVVLGISPWCFTDGARSLRVVFERVYDIWAGNVDRHELPARCSQCAALG